MNPFKHKSNRQSARRGFTLLEVTIGSMMAAMVTIMASGVAFDVSRHFVSNIAETRVAAESRLAIESLRRDFSGSSPDVSTGERSEWRLVGRLIPSVDELRLCYDAEQDGSADWIAPDRVITYTLVGNELIRTDAVSGNVYRVARFVDDVQFVAAAGVITVTIDFALGDFTETYTFETGDL